MKPYTGRLDITKEALLQIYTIKQNDFTLKNCEFRIRIDGKGCNGFSYDLGFSPIKEDDQCFSIPTKVGDIRVILDPFTAHYVQDAELFFTSSDESGESGFTVVNRDEKNFEGKFFENEDLLPNL